MRVFQIANGLGAGNIGDELMARALWEALPPDLALDIPLFPESRLQHEPYPPQHRYLPIDWGGNENASAAIPGLLAGDTPVTENEGLDWPLRFLAPRLQHFHDRGLPVDAVGVGVDRLHTPQGLELFRAFAPIRSWTVRSHDCSDALEAMGIPKDRIRVGADWAWLYRPKSNLTDWARQLWATLGVDPARPLLVANVVNMIWRDAVENRRNIAAGLDDAARRYGLQIAFFCNECRPGEFFDFEASREIAGLMSTPATLVPNEYYSPGEALAIVGCASVALGQRYHFVVEAALAGVPPVAIVRGQKMRTLVKELGIPVAGSVEEVGRDNFDAAIAQAMENRSAVLARVEDARLILTRRAASNLSFFSASLSSRHALGL